MEQREAAERAVVAQREADAEELAHTVAEGAGPGAEEEEEEDSESPCCVAA